MKTDSWGNQVEERLTGLLGEAGFSVKNLSGQTALQPAQATVGGIDILLEAENVQGRQFEIALEVKSSGEPRIARMALQQLREYLQDRPETYGVFGAPYISEETGELCKKEGVGYVDAAGNCYLSFGSTYILLKGNPNPYKNGKQLKSLFSPKSSRVLRVMLSDPKKRWFVRDLAREADISLGQVSNIKKRLLDYELIDEEKKAFKLTRPENLLRRWSENYRYLTNPGRNYYSLLPPRELEKKFAGYCGNASITYAFTLFSGAARVAPSTRYNRSFAYVTAFPEQAAAELGLKEVSTGATITLLEPYDEGVLYARQDINGEKVVCDIQLYLDLKSFGGRGEEAAAVILEQRIQTKW